MCVDEKAGDEWRGDEESRFECEEDGGGCRWWPGVEGGAV